MHLDKYSIYRDEINDAVYWFNSEGPKGKIRKLVQFQKTDYPNVYNLALGDVNETTIDFTNITDNKDTKKVLASITDIVQDYTKRFQSRWILVTGDSIAKTRLYQMHLSNNFEEIRKAGYNVLGLNYGQPPQLFTRNKTYDAFLVKRQE